MKTPTAASDRPRTIVNYTTLSLADIRIGLAAVARETRAEFGALDARQLNWRPDAARWSVAQCFDHLITANQMVIQKMNEALTSTGPRTVWQRLPLWPSLLGRLLIRSQAPAATRKFTAPAPARPSTSDIAPDAIERFAGQQHDFAMRLQTLDEPTAAHAIMTSPFARAITYSALDGCRLIVAHNHRHIEQARRVTQSRAFPSGGRL